MKKYSILFLIVGIGLLIVIMQKFVLPLVYDVVKSDAFLVESKDEGSQLPISNAMTNIAFMQCNNHVKTELGENASVNFPPKPLNVWSLGNYQYIVNAAITVTEASGTATKKYVCRITYENGDNQEGVNEADNWSLEGLDGV